MSEKQNKNNNNNNKNSNNNQNKNNNERNNNCKQFYSLKYKRCKDKWVFIL